MADMSSSLKVVNIALVFCASFSLLAIFNLILFIFTLCSLLVPAQGEDEQDEVEDRQQAEGCAEHQCNVDHLQ